MSADETIAAIATAPGEGGIAVVRLSGNRSLSLADQVFRGRGPKPSKRPAFSVAHGYVHHGAEDIDEVLLLVLRKPHSYTGEDTVEFQGHGGMVVARRILQVLIAAGARPAEPGEFTRRAFLNGRIDLVQAEAVLDLIRARSERAATLAMTQLEGMLSLSIEGIYNAAVSLAADVEAMLDFPEEDLPVGETSALAARLEELCLRTTSLLNSWQEGRVLREGARVVILGRPNAGKSSLMNRLLGSERSIVTDAPGTTRDFLEETAILAGYPIVLVDTAGLRESSCHIEKEGIRRTLQQAERADLLLYVVDAAAGIHEIDKVHIKEFSKKKLVLVHNKIDIAHLSHDYTIATDWCTKCCASDGRGIEDVRTAIIACLGLSGFATPEQHAAVSERHRELLAGSLSEFQEALKLLESASALDLALPASHLRHAAERLGLITGKIYDEDLLDSIFSRFCIGK
jgi:tRNA modification GTPase